MSRAEIIYIAAEHIRPHPDNPRKNLGGLVGIGGIHQGAWSITESYRSSDGRRAGRVHDADRT